MGKMRNWTIYRSVRGLVFYRRSVSGIPYPIRFGIVEDTPTAREYSVGVRLGA